MEKACSVCKGEGWVCEDHTDQPWDLWHQENCGAGQMCLCENSNARALVEDTDDEVTVVYPTNADTMRIRTGRKRH